MCFSVDRWKTWIMSIQRLSPWSISGHILSWCERFSEDGCERLESKLRWSYSLIQHGFRWCSWGFLRRCCICNSGMLLKFSLLVYNDDETWALHKFAKIRRLYCFGDRKTIENSTAFVNKLSNSSLSFEQLAFKQKFSLTHSIGSYSCQVISTLVWTSYSPSINFSGQICSNLCGIT